MDNMDSIVLQAAWATVVALCGGDDELAQSCANSREEELEPVLLAPAVRLYWRAAQAFLDSSPE